MTDLVIDTRLLAETVRHLDGDVRGNIADVNVGLRCFAVIDEALRDLAGLKRYLENRLGSLMVAKRCVIDGVGVFERYPYRLGRYRCIDEDGLWRAVLGARVVTADGEILAPIDAVVRAYGAESRDTGKMRLTGASPMKVEALGIEPDDFFERSPRAGWRIQVIH